MTYLGMPFGMWTMFAGSFQKQLTVVFGYDVDTAKALTTKAQPTSRELLSELRYLGVSQQELRALVKEVTAS